MTLPSHDEFLRERFDQLKGQAQSLVTSIASEGTSQYAALASIVPALLELAAYFKEPLAFEVDPGALALKKSVMEAVGPLVK